VSRLYFAAVGDCRPPSVDQTSQYPTAIIQKIFSDMASLTVKPQFALATGDYMFASKNGSAGAPQIQNFLTAASSFPGVLFPALGNHECTGYTDSNCGSGNTDGITHNYADFMNDMMAPLGQTKPYYRFDVDDTAGHWTAKFLVLAMNAWDSAQSSWLTTQLQQATDYTFIVRHEPESTASYPATAPGVDASDAIIAQHPYTLKIVGHTHEFHHASGSRQVIVGNGGAPLASSSQRYGYAIFQVLADGSVQVDDYDYQSNAPIQSVNIPK